MTHEPDPQPRLSAGQLRRLGVASRFYPIFDGAGWLRRMLPMGVKFVQLRIKDADEAHLRAEIAEALEVSEGDRVFVTDARWWLGGLNAGHALVGTIDNDDGVGMGPTLWDNVVTRRRTNEPVVVMRT